MVLGTKNNCHNNLCCSITLSVKSYETGYSFTMGSYSFNIKSISGPHLHKSVPFLFLLVSCPSELRKSSEYQDHEFPMTTFKRTNKECTNIAITASPHLPRPAETRPPPNPYRHDPPREYNNYQGEDLTILLFGLSRRHLKTVETVLLTS